MFAKKIAVMAALVPALTLALGSTMPAHASTDDGVCRVGVVLPSKLAITSYLTRYGVRLTGDLSCFTYATWDVSEGLISTGATVSFYYPNTSGFFGYVGKPVNVHALPRQGAYSLKSWTDPTTNATRSFTVVESASNTMVAKYDSRIAWKKPKKSGKLLTLSAEAASVNDSSRIFGNYAAWSKAKVRFQIQRTGKWKTVATVKTDAKGVARATVKFHKGTWRAITVDSSTTWGRTTGSHKL